MIETLITAAEQVAAVLPAEAGLAEVVADKGYHSNETMVAFAELDIRSYVSEPDRGRRTWKGKAAARDAVYANRRRIRGSRGQRLLRQRGERLERPNAHLYETGGMRRVHLRGHPNILKRLLVQVCGFNLGLLMRQLMGVGTPRSLQGRAAALAQPARGWGWPYFSQPICGDDRSTFFACTFDPGAQAVGTISEFFREMARPPGLEPGTLG